MDFAAGVGGLGGQPRPQRVPDGRIDASDGQRSTVGRRSCGAKSGGGSGGGGRSGGERSGGGESGGNVEGQR